MSSYKDDKVYAEVFKKKIEDYFENRKKLKFIKII